MSKQELAHHRRRELGRAAETGIPPVERRSEGPNRLAAQTFDLGENRYPFGVFTLGNEQVSDADVALYFAKDGKGPVTGPLPAQVTSLETKPAYRASGAGAPPSP